MADEVQNPGEPVESPANEPGSSEAHEVPAECPMCRHKFFHKIGHAFGGLGHAIKSEAEKAGEGLGNAIGDATFGGTVV